MDQLDALHALLAVIDHGGFAAAARALNTSPAKVTRLIQDLEHKLNARLLNRTTRTLSLTEAGELYAGRVRPAVEALRAAQDEVTTYNSLPSGVLRVNSLLDFAVTQLIPRVPRFSALYPQLELDVQVADRLQMTPDLDADLTILFSRQPLPSGDFVARRLAMTSGVLCAAPQYLKRHGLPLHPKDLVRHNCLIPSSKELPETFMLTWVGEGAVDPFEFHPGAPKFHSNSPEALRHAALHGLGLVGMLSVHAQPYLRSGALVRVLPDWVGERWEIWAAYSGRKHVPRKVHALLDFLRQELGDPLHDPWLF
ncbi:LysR family transcriptional regulator [Curvibacter sp. HBC61]|uniref:LysR family transcriptional regulator n=1 Tax=Curvibacter cyanobacteriorum TaxID=3026422 RepID=A0ABT5MVI0_9BURK|nr:LysR family transcriptional regulator [Curvibacter sp. HBC61]MDD0838064.1 LysR family transcriptional regulator [Curvibacter sp. HBC61]